MLNKSKGNMYDFVTHTWNTIKGQCYHDCSYCYMKRWKNQKPVRFDEKELNTDLGSGNFIFVGSSNDMFAENIPDTWILGTLKKCLEYHKNKYLFQTKNPELIFYWEKCHGLSDNPVICTTIETNRYYPKYMGNSPTPIVRSLGMEILRTQQKYVTIEPIMDFDLEPLIEIIKRCNPIQVNIGADSGNNHLPEPSWDKIEELINRLSESTIVKQKKNLSRLKGVAI